MTIELLVVVTVLGSGVLILRAAGLDGWGLPPLGLLAGASLLTTIATLQASLGLPTAPAMTLALLALAAGAVWVWTWRGDPGVALPLLPSLGVVVALGPAVWLLREANLARVTPDSFNLIMSGTLMHRGRLGEVPPDFLEDWQVALGALHGAANAQGEFYLRSITPLIGVATVAALVWFVARALETTGHDPRAVRWTAWFAGALLLTNQRFLYNAFYLNRHVLIAALLLITAASAWGLIRGTVGPERLLVVLAAISLPGLALGRAETPLVAGMVLVPLLASSSVRRGIRIGLLALLGATMTLWYGPLVVRFAASDLPMSMPSVIMLVLGIVALIAAALIRYGWRALDPLPRWSVPAIEVLLWLGVVAAVTIDLHVLRESIVSTIQNVVFEEGGWGISLLVLAPMVLVVALVTRGSDRAQLRFPLTAFVPLALLLAYVRADGGLPYRVGRGDSLNRMLLHLVPLAIFYVATATTAIGRRSGPTSREHPVPGREPSWPGPNEPTARHPSRTEP
jgi:hypothetical protein